MARLFNLARMTTATTGTGTVTLGSAVSGYLSFAGAGVQDGDTVDYAISDGGASEIGTGVYTASGTTLTRAVTDSTNSGSAINLSGTAEVFISPRAETLQRPPRGHLWGLTLSNDATTPNTVVDISAGESASDDATLSRLMVSGAFSKTTGSWSSGTGNGGLDTGSVAASTWYHVFQIMRSDTGAVDFLISTSATAPTMPTNYDHKRRIGSVKTDGSSNIIAFVQTGDHFAWKTPSANDVSSALSATATSFTVNSPLGVSVLANWQANALATGTNSGFVRVYDPALDDIATSSSNSSASFGVIANSNSTAIRNSSNGWACTNTSSQLRAVSDISTTLSLRVIGWIDTRGRLA